MKIDLWDVVAIIGAGLLGAGVWRGWGWHWACIMWGGLLVTISVIHALAVARGAMGGK